MSVEQLIPSVLVLNGSIMNYPKAHSGLTQQASIISHFLLVISLGLAYWVLGCSQGVARAVILLEGSTREGSTSKLTEVVVDRIHILAGCSIECLSFSQTVG